eukprot:323697-Chlamydomonas_euryale.AAC.12
MSEDLPSSPPLPRLETCRPLNSTQPPLTAPDVFGVEHALNLRKLPRLLLLAHGQAADESPPSELALPPSVFATSAASDADAAPAVAAVAFAAAAAAAVATERRRRHQRVRAAPSLRHRSNPGSERFRGERTQS